MSSILDVRYSPKDLKEMDEFKRRELYKEGYDYLTPLIIERKGHFVSPYFLDWNAVLNDNEFTVWCSCRGNNVPLFPQYPVGKYWLDFGNPYFKIGVEVDSKTYHDKEKDELRDEELKKLGWKMYHLTSREAFWATGKQYYDYDLYYDHEEMIEKYKDYLIHTVCGVLMCINHVSMHKCLSPEFEDTAQIVAYRHQLIEY